MAPLIRPSTTRTPPPPSQKPSAQTAIAPRPEAPSRAWQIAEEGGLFDRVLLKTVEIHQLVAELERLIGRTGGWPP
jgi:hypothetical protein